MKYNNLKKVNEMYESVKFNGFTAYPNNWVGFNLRGQPIATTGWYSGGNVLLYTKQDGKWEKKWTDLCLFSEVFRNYVVSEMSVEDADDWYSYHNIV